MVSVKKCVITYLPNSAALKMDGATTLFRFSTQLYYWSRRTCCYPRSIGVVLYGGFNRADLGGSSDNSIGILKTGVEKGFSLRELTDT